MILYYRVGWGVASGDSVVEMPLTSFVSYDFPFVPAFYLFHRWALPLPYMALVTLHLSQHLRIRMKKNLTTIMNTYFLFYLSTWDSSIDCSLIISSKDTFSTSHSLFHTFRRLFTTIYLVHINSLNQRQP